MYELPDSVRVVLAIDPGADKTGFALVGVEGVLMEYGLLRPKREGFHCELDRLIALADWLVIEKPYLAMGVKRDGTRKHTNVATLMVQGNTVGGIRMLWSRVHGLKTITAFPSQTWQSGYRIGGRMNRAARKEASVRIAKLFTNGQEVGPDVADAILMGLFFARHTNRFYTNGRFK